jgi:hypothetical protein
MTEHVESSKDFSIDRYQLELEAEGISDLILHYGKQAAKWGAKEKEEKRKLEVIHAACAAFIREDPKSYGLKKDTDAVVLKIAMDEPDYRDQHKIWLETFQLKEEYESAVRALLQKGSMIKELVKLWLNHFSIG